MSATMRIAGVIASGLVLFGCATTPQNQSKPAATAATKDSNCLTETGSRIPPAGKAGCRGYGRSYSDEDIQRTGSTNAADALSLLDPSITVHK
jgi:hypothetical protein